MADRIELFERRNRLRIVALVFLATLDYIVAVVMAAIALGIGISLRELTGARPRPVTKHAHASGPDQQAHDDEQDAPDDLAPQECEDSLQ
jgi:hypothetical protein